MKKGRRQKKYFAPQTESSERLCDHEGCCEKGEYRAPKDKNLKEYYWFCLRHVQEYNAKWNYYDGIADRQPEEEEAPKRRFRFKSKINYNFKDYSGFFSEYASDFKSFDDIYYNEEEKKALDIMEMEDKPLDLKILKKQYKKLVKKYHPDVNQGDKKKEEKFKQLTHAYNLLLKKIS